MIFRPIIFQTIPTETPFFRSNRTASINTGWGLNPPTIGVVSFDGADAVGYPYNFSPGDGPADTLLSCPIDLDAEPTELVGLSFYYQPQGTAFFSPEPTDSLRLEFFAPELDQWFRVWSTNDLSDPDGFTFVYIPINSLNYLVEGFQFRFTNYAALQGAISTWNIDYVWLDRNQVNLNPTNNDVAFARQESTLLDGLTAMPLSHFATNPPAYMRQDLNVLLRNLNSGPRTLEGNTISLKDPFGGTTTFTNPNNPQIPGQSELTYTHGVAAMNSIVFDATLATTELIYEVLVAHGVEDFAATTSNDTMKFEQRFFTHYAYDDGHAEAAYAVASSGSEVAMRYTNFLSDSVFALQIYTMPIEEDVENAIFNIRIWEDSGNGPGALVSETQRMVAYGQDSYQQVPIYSFEEPVFVPSGSFYFGYGQGQNTQRLRIGLDLNTSGNSGNLYFRETSSWEPSQFPGSVMIRPMFTSNGYDTLISGLETKQSIVDFKLYPNPSSEWISLAHGGTGQLAVIIYDLAGRELMHQRIAKAEKINISHLPEGFYLINALDDRGARGSKKLVISR